MSKETRTYLIAAILGVIVPWLIVGCAKVTAKVPVVMPDKTVKMVELEYVRYWNQKIGDFYLETPDGWIIGFNKQEADNSATFMVGPYRVTIGGGPK